jgi:hypothetical protein
MKNIIFPMICNLILQSNTVSMHILYPITTIGVGIDRHNGWLGMDVQGIRIVSSAGQRDLFSTEPALALGPT